MPRCSSASCRAMALMMVESMPMLSALTRSISRACSATPRKMLPPPTTTATSTPSLCTSAISEVISATFSASRPNPRDPDNASPESLRTILLYIPIRVSHIETAARAACLLQRSAFRSSGAKSAACKSLDQPPPGLSRAQREHLGHIDAQGGGQIVLMLLFLGDDPAKLFGQGVVAEGFGLLHALPILADGFGLVIQ